MRRAAALALAGLAAAGALAACGSKHDRIAPGAARPLSLMLDYFPNADHVGIYAAQARGMFTRAGLRVGIHAPSDPSAPLKLLSAGRVDVAISYEPELLLARDRGAPLVSVGAIVQRPLTSIVAVGDAGVHAPADLAGKRVGTAGIPYQHAYLQTILRGAHVDPATVTETNVGFNLVPAMVSKKVDATLGAFWNYEGIQLRQLGRRPVVIPVDRAGVPTYDELVLVVRRSELSDRATRSRLRRFIQALASGYGFARADPGAAVADLVALNPGLARARPLQLASVRATLPAFFPRPGRPYGHQDVRQWAAYGRWMRSQGLLRRPPAPQLEVTNELLPGQGI